LKILVSIPIISVLTNDNAVYLEIDWLEIEVTLNNAVMNVKILIKCDMA
jgi:hypothetical protein